LKYLGEKHRLNSSTASMLTCHITCLHCKNVAKNYTAWRIEDVIYDIFGFRRAPYWEKKYDKITKILQKYKQEGMGAITDNDIKFLKKMQRTLPQKLPDGSWFYLIIEGLNELLEEGE